MAWDTCLVILQGGSVGLSVSKGGEGHGLCHTIVQWFLSAPPIFGGDTEVHGGLLCDSCHGKVFTSPGGFTKLLVKGSWVLEMHTTVTR